jgi:hypothetical protein
VRPVDPGASSRTEGHTVLITNTPLTSAATEMVVHCSAGLGATHRIYGGRGAGGGSVRSSKVCHSDGAPSHV